MKIIETEFNDFKNKEDITTSKNKLAVDVIHYVQLIFSKEYNDKLKEIKEIKRVSSEKKEMISKSKNELESLLKVFSKKNKESQLLRKMGKLVQAGLIQESMKTEMSNILNSFDSLSEEKISSYLTETIRLLSQKFAKS